MKAHRCLLVSALMLMAASTFAGQPKYKLVWKENFLGNHFNEKFWSKIPRGTSDWNRRMSDHPSLYKVEKGRLVLRGVVNDGLVPDDPVPFLTGGVYTKNKKTITYGKVEVRAKLHAAKGAWPAIWMLPNDKGWPDGGEIDIMERLNGDSIAYQTVHSYYTYVLKQETPRKGATGPIDPDGYNVYAVEILPDSLVFSINDRRTFSYPRIQTDKPGQYPFGTPFYLLIDMQIEGQWVGKADPKDYPVEMWIDWVKMYELKENR